ncbi:serine/threonine protein kinase [Kibdelosporangium aridum]|uniref:serine/threonine protein kinase n=1 Tax=Kibdelosporangium aridum TaxID=2030 RepID=UPI0035E5C5D7
MPAPEFIGRYAIKRFLGAGGFAVVWLAHDDRLDDHVAIKVLADNWSQRLDLRERFIKEARVLRRTESQRVVDVYDIDELPDGRPYFVMTYADRGSLADELRDRRISVGQALRYGAEIAHAIQDLHDAGVIHRDVKPSNVLFRSASDGSARLLIADLGLARDIDRGSRFTMAVGTPGYMAPEQSGSSSGLDARADVFGIGATVYFALTGQPPSSDPPSTFRPGLPAGTDEAVLRAMHQDPDQRWQTAGEFAAELERLSEHADHELESAITDIPPAAVTGEVLTDQHVLPPVAVIAPEAPPPAKSRKKLGIAAAAAAGVIALTAALLFTAVWSDRPTTRTAQDGTVAPTATQTVMQQVVSTVPSSASAPAPPPSAQSVKQKSSGPQAPPAVTPPPAGPDKPLPGTLTKCGGGDKVDCFLFSRGNTAYALDFYTHNHEVVMWERKPANDTYAYSQRWQFWQVGDAYMIYNTHMKRCLSIDGGGVGDRLRVADCAPSSAKQLWNWTDTRQLKSKLGMCVDVPRAEYFNGAAPFGYGCAKGTNQEWLPTPA